MVTEWCPFCEEEVEIKAQMRVQKCPNCGENIIPCCLCDMDKADCANCKLSKECE